MKQVLNNLRTGEVSINDVPVPKTARGHLLIRTLHSVISVGTEKMLVGFGRANYLQKARQQPDKVKMVIDKVKTDGLSATVQSVTSKLDQPMTLGYSNVGRVVEVGEGVQGYEVGDLVMSNGPHAEYVRVPVNLCARVPDGVTADEAAYGVLGSIALQGVRLASPQLGETIVVIGLGLLGLITVQLLRANGCRVIGVDLDPSRVALAEKFGARGLCPSQGDDPVEVVTAMTGGNGADAALLTLATDRSEPVSQAANMLRKRGRIILVGVTGLELRRPDFYEKELSFQVSCSYGPGRYDDNYELKGQDYPIGFVRWTEQRNFQAVLELLANGALSFAPLTSRRVALADVADAYDGIFSDAEILGVVIDYPTSDDDGPVTETSRRVSLNAPKGSSKRAVVGMIGAGAFAGHTLIPAVADTGARLHTIVSAQGVSGTHQARKHGFEVSASDIDAVLDQDEINTLVIASRHNQHASMLIAGLKAGKSVFVEKPLAMTLDELAQVEAAYHDAREKDPNLIVMVGYNRRFSPVVAAAADALKRSSSPSSHIYICNAGHIDVSHWTQDPAVGGGRIIGEACHMIDLLMCLAGSTTANVADVTCAPTTPGVAVADTVSIALELDGGSIGTVHYFANGSRQFPKERITSFKGGSVIEIDNFRAVRGFGSAQGMKQRMWKQDKGHAACMKAFIDAVGTGRAPVEFDTLASGARAAIVASSKARTS
ncbi:MAG: bi-domain-containing oxidoreductase [Pseudomonadota bacterium]